MVYKDYKLYQNNNLSLVPFKKILKISIIIDEKIFGGRKTSIN